MLSSPQLDIITPEIKETFVNKICRLGEGRAVALAERRKLRKKMRELIEEHVSPELKDDFHAIFNKVCEAYCK